MADIVTTLRARMAERLRPEMVSEGGVAIVADLCADVLREAMEGGELVAKDALEHCGWRRSTSERTFVPPPPTDGYWERVFRLRSTP